MKSNNRWPLSPLLACVIALIVFGCGDKKKKPATAKAASATLDRPGGGTANPKVDVLAFVDYQCPFCKASAAELLKVAGTHKAVMRLRILNLPLEVHDGSVDLALASVAGLGQK